jgi:hypothetical protein
MDGAARVSMFANVTETRSTRTYHSTVFFRFVVKDWRQFVGVGHLAEYEASKVINHQKAHRILIKNVTPLEQIPKDSMPTRR